MVGMRDNVNLKWRENNCSVYRRISGGIPSSSMVIWAGVKQCRV